MLAAPKSLRMHIGLFGRRNVGKSSLMNALLGFPMSIVSEVAGTTTDPVEKAVEMPPLGPVVFVDTAGVDDVGDLGALRSAKTREVLGRVDLALVVSDETGLGPFERQLIADLRSQPAPEPLERCRAATLTGLLLFSTSINAIPSTLVSPP